jgi:hypothetical protein
MLLLVGTMFNWEQRQLRFSADISHNVAVLLEQLDRRIEESPKPSASNSKRKRLSVKPQSNPLMKSF